MFILIFVAIGLITPSSSEATALRGRIDGQNSSTGIIFRVSGVSVAVYDVTGQLLITTTFTGQDGMYYIQLKPSSYVLVIDRRLSVPINVGPSQFQDIQPFLLQF